MDQKKIEERLAAATARGIANEKTRESIAVYKVIGAVLLAWLVGAVAGSVLAGVIVMLALFVPIWRTYTGNPITNKWYRRTVVGFWVVLGALVVLSAGLSWWAGSNARPVAEAAKTPAQIRHEQIQSALNKAFIPVQMQIQSVMNDPDSFELVNTGYTDQGEYLVLTVTFRGRNQFGAKVLNSMDARVGLDGSVWSVGKIE